MVLVSGLSQNVLSSSRWCSTQTLPGRGQHTREREAEAFSTLQGQMCDGIVRRGSRLCFPCESQRLSFLRSPRKEGIPYGKSENKRETHRSWDHHQIGSCFHHAPGRTLLLFRIHHRRYSSSLATSGTQSSNSACQRHVLLTNHPASVTPLEKTERALAALPDVIRWEQGTAITRNALHLHTEGVREAKAVASLHLCDTQRKAPLCLANRVSRRKLVSPVRE